MGPIDFSKFTAIKNEYLAFYDVCDLSAKLASLETKFPNFKKYINYFNDKTKLENIITADNVELLKLKKLFDTCQINFEYAKCCSPNKKKDSDKNCNVCKECILNKEKLDFHEEIMAVLDYANRGKTNLRKLYSKVGLKTCYICNAQYALAINPESISTIGTSSKQTRYAAKFQFDHYLPKDRYPALSISFYNLLPICSSCNLIKGNREIGIDFLSTESSKWDDKFTFNVLENSLSSFLLDQKPIEIDFIDKYDYGTGILPLSERYDIKGIYNTQIDLIEELIMRKLKYSETYKDKLSMSFPKLFTNIDIDERIELGTYTKKEEIHKRPMSKFLQDINNQLDRFFQEKLKE